MLSHLREVCSEDRTKDHALAEMLKDISLSHREVERLTGVDRRRLKTAEPQPRHDLRDVAEEDKDFIRAWIISKCPPLNNKNKFASQSLGGGRREYHQIHLKFTSKKKLLEEFRLEHPFFRSIAQTTFNQLFPWFVREGKPEQCVCHYHLSLRVLLDEYRRLAPKFHYNFAAGRAKEPHAIDCNGCRQHPFASMVGELTTRASLSSHEAISRLVCRGACEPATANRICCRVLDRGEAPCGQCGWSIKVPRCPAEWADSGSYEWQQVGAIMIETAKGNEKYDHVLQLTTGTAKQFMTLLEKTFETVLPHHFIWIWQEFAWSEIPRQMPENHMDHVA